MRSGLIPSTSSRASAAWCRRCGTSMSAHVFGGMVGLFAFRRMSTVALTAQALGAGNVVEERATLMRALLVSAAGGLALIALQVPLGALIFRLMGASAETTRAAEVYF